MKANPGPTGPWCGSRVSFGVSLVCEAASQQCGQSGGGLLGRPLTVQLNE
jgi:hypothetical protein